MAPYFPELWSMNEEYNWRRHRFVDANNVVKVYMKSHLGFLNLGFHDILLLSRDMCSIGLGIITGLELSWSTSSKDYFNEMSFEESVPYPWSNSAQWCVFSKLSCVSSKLLRCNMDWQMAGTTSNLGFKSFSCPARRHRAGSQKYCVIAVL